MIRLLGLDFDGTLVENRADGPIVSSQAIARLNRLVERGVVAGIVTGNAWWTARAGLQHAGTKWTDPFPNFVVSREAFIHWKDGDGSMHGDTEWNQKRAEDFGRLIAWLANSHYELYEEMSAEGFRIQRFHLLGDYGLEAYFSTEKEAEAARVWLERRIKPQPLARAHRNRTNANVVLATAGKGVSLLRVAQTRGIDACDVLAIGDGLNDVDMLDGTLGMLCATTDNAAARVKEIVLGAKGFIATKQSTWGLDEVLSNFSDRGLLPG